MTLTGPLGRTINLTPIELSNMDKVRLVQISPVVKLINKR